MARSGATKGAAPVSRPQLVRRSRGAAVINSPVCIASKESSMYCYLSAPRSAPGRAPSWSPVTPWACTRPRPYCCSPLSYLQLCQEREKGGEDGGGGGKWVGKEGPRIVFSPALLEEIESTGIL